SACSASTRSMRTVRLSSTTRMLLTASPLSRIHKSGQCRTDLPKRKHAVSGAEQHGFPRHSEHNGRRLVLRYRHATGSPNGEQSGGAIAAHASEERSRNGLAVFVGHGFEQVVDRRTARVPLGSLIQPDTPVAYRHVVVGRGKQHLPSGLRNGFPVLCKTCRPLRLS